jgi:hypothetical protein
MANGARIGTDWDSDELDAIVADYFAMLMAELVGESYVKAKHSKALIERIGRPHGSVEFKHQNISAVLDHLGMPWIRGYKPRRNFQSAIFDAIDRYLSGHPSVIEILASPPSQPASAAGIFVPPPPMTPERVPARLERLVQKFDPVERDHRNRSLGRAGEEFVIGVEQRRLCGAKRPDLARKIRWISAEEGDGAGYDVLSFEPNGRERLLEIKTTNGSARTPFFLSRTEREIASERPADWRIYRVHLFSTEPRIFSIAPPLEEWVHLSPESWRASF